MRVLLVEDHKPLVRALRQGLEEEGFAVDVAYDGEEGDFKARTANYDVIILDLHAAQGRRPVAAAALAQGRRDDATSSILTARDSIEDKVEGLDLGADDYLTKPFELEELLARLRALIRRGHQVKDPILRVHDLEIDTAGRTVKRGGQTIHLTPREYALLRVPGVPPRQGRHPLHDLGHLYDEQDENTSNVVDVYIRYLRNKIDKGFEPPLILTRWGEGYMLRGRIEPCDPSAYRLLVYFLGLLAVALGAAAVLAYRTGQQTLIAKKEADREADQGPVQGPLPRGRGTARTTRCWRRPSAWQPWPILTGKSAARLRPLHLFGMFGMEATPGGYFLAPIWMAESVRVPNGPPGVPRLTFVNPIWDEMNKLKDYPLNVTLYEIRFKAGDIDVLEHLDGQVAEFFQVDAEGFSPYRSQMLENPEEGIDRWLPLNLKAFAPDQAAHHEFNDVELEPGLVVHRVILKTPPGRPLFRPGPRPQRSLPDGEPTVPEPPRRAAP